MNIILGNNNNYISTKNNSITIIYNTNLPNQISTSLAQAITIDDICMSDLENCENRKGKDCYGSYIDCIQSKNA
jgi:hypothetical protein